MKSDTPIAEVAAFLPVDAANFLLTQTVQVQETVLMTVRGILVYWEGVNCNLTPVELESVINSLVFAITPAHQQLMLARTTLAAIDEVTKADIAFTKLFATMPLLDLGAKTTAMSTIRTVLDSERKTLQQLRNGGV